MLLPDYKPLEYETVFAADAMFFHSAKAALVKARAATKGVERAKRALQRHADRLRAASDVDDDGRHVNYDEFESLAIAMESVEYQVTEAHGPVFQQLALVHILSATSLEAHINIRAETLLSGRSWKAFERLAVDAKWLFFPKVLGLAGFDPGTQPFQGLDAVAAARNKLVHYKPVREAYHGFDEPSGFAERLYLTFDSCVRSLRTVEAMVTELAKQLGEDMPWWFRSNSSHFFVTREKSG